MPMSTDKDKKDAQRSKESYLLNIYRRNSDQAESMVGTIENIVGNRKGRFKTARELIEWLERAAEK